MGYRLFRAQHSSRYRPGRPIRGGRNGSKIEVIDTYSAGYYRAVYMVRFSGAAYVLHCLQMPWRQGIAAPKTAPERAKMCLNLAEDECATMNGDSPNSRPDDSVDIHYGSGNVFADLGLPRPDECLAKAQLVSLISRLVDERGLTYRRAAEVMDTDQASVSKIIGGKLTELSADWLIGRVLRLGLDIDVVIHDTGRKNGLGVIKIELD